MKTLRLPHVDVLSLLLFASGLSGIVSAIGITGNENHTTKVVVGVLGGVSFLAGQSIRVFYNPTSIATATVIDAVTHEAVPVPVAPPTPASTQVTLHEGTDPR